MHGEASPRHAMTLERERAAQWTLRVPVVPAGFNV
jgi:hypothetical protein